MSTLSGLELLHQMPQNQKVLPCFDVGGGNLDMIHAVCRELKKTAFNAFLSSTYSSIDEYYGLGNFVDLVKSVSAEYGVAVSIHLDHATETLHIKQALDNGFTSIMFDGSKLPLAENIVQTNQLHELAKAYGASLEVEVGTIGGKEDDVISKTSNVTSLIELKEFIKSAEFDYLAPGIGNVHGHYSSVDLDWKLISDIQNAIHLPLVLHGGSGLSDHHLSNILKSQFVKLNIATDIRLAYINALRISLDTYNDINKPSKLLRQGRIEVEKYVKTILKICEK